jgi:phenylalanyl-tRNA synthetase beta chain
VGLRAINNIVDITNYVMMELGQPLHAFDAAKLTGDLNVRQANEGEEFFALDGKTYQLSAGHMVIADQAKALAIAGVMGGQDSGVTEATTDIWLESAYFVSQSIRRTSRQLGISTDSSYRFERGIDLSNLPVATQRAVDLIVELSGGRPDSAARASASVIKHTPALVKLRSERIKTILGIDVAAARVDQILAGFGLKKQADDTWQVPGFRSDLTREIDLIEEIARVVGLDAIPSRRLANFSETTTSDHAYDRAMELRRVFVAQGLHEARSLTLVPSEPIGLAATQTSAASLLRVKNPMIDEQVVLRPNLLHGLLSSLRDNLRAGAESVWLYEIGRVFAAAKGRDTREEFQHAALVICGPRNKRDWRNAQGMYVDIFDAKGMLTRSLRGIVSYEKDTNPALALSLVVKVNGKPVGFLGQLWPADARTLDCEMAVCFAELDLVALAKAEQQNGASGKYRDIPRFPAVVWDIAMLAPKETAHGSVVDALLGQKEPLLENVELFDVYMDPSGEKIPATHKSLAYSLTYRSSERTLTADEVNTAHAKLKDRLKALGVTLRE